MSADPFANTTTVKNILQHIISPKIVSDGAGGYVTKTDLVNVDNLLFTTNATTDGTELNPLTSQVGTFSFPEDRKTTSVYHSRVTPNSVILAVTQESAGVYVVSVVPEDGRFAITLNVAGYLGKVGWFIASF